MTHKIKILLLLISLMASKTFAQITTTINNISVNNQSNIINCNLIDIGTTSSNNLVINFRITKPTAQANMAGIVKIYLNNPVGTSGSYTIGGEFNVQSSMWLDNGNGITSVIGTVSCNFDSSSIRVTGSSVNIGFVIGSNATTSSCSYPLQKTQLPEFGLNIPSVSIPCGSLPSVLVGVVNIFNSPGTLSYSWNAYGWVRNGSVVNSPFTTTSNTITLTPASATSLPSNVTVTTFLNGSSQGTKTLTVSRPAFTTNATISGADKFCSPITSSVYTIANVGAGNNVTWSSSNTAVATISNPTVTQVTLNKVGFGNVRVQAIITNSCGQPVGVSREVQILDPVVIDTTNFAYAPTINNQWCDSKWHYVEILFPYQEGIIPQFFSTTYNAGTIPSDIPGGIIYKFGKGFAGQFQYDIYFSNGCAGIEYMSEDWTPLMIKTCRQIGQFRSSISFEKEFSVFPNPAKDLVSIALQNEENFLKENAIIYGQLYNKMGQLKQNIEIIDSIATFSVQDFQKGIYFLKIDNNGEIETHQVSVE